MLSDELRTRLLEVGIENSDETALREALEARIETFTLFKLAPWPARRWKCHYRLMMREKMYDGQSAEDAYALALLEQLQSSELTPPHVKEGG